MQVLLRLLRYASRSRHRSGLALALALLGVLIELARPWPLKLVVDYVLSGRPQPPRLALVTGLLRGARTPHGLLLWSLAAAVGVAAAGALVTMTMMKVGLATAQRIVCDLLLDLFEKLQRLSLAYHGRHTIGDLLQRISADVLVVYYALGQVVLPTVISLVTLGGMFFIMAKLDLTLSLVSLSIVPTLAIAMAVCRRPMDAATLRQSESQGSLMALVEQSLSGIKAIQGFAREDWVQRKVEGRALEVGRASSRALLVTAGFNQVAAIITGLGAAAVLGLGARRVMDGRLSVGDLLVFLGYVAALFGPVTSLAMATGYGFALAARGRRVFEVLDSEEYVPEHPHSVDPGRARGEVVFENVSFGYETEGPGSGGRPVLRGVSFHAWPGQITAIVGATGAGKTSLVSLLSRFYDPWDGRILLDGHDLRQWKLRSLRESVSLVLQEPFLFPVSVAENIGFGRPDTTRAEIAAAAKAARAHDFIERLPKGYDTVIGEKGSSLSGGERQRIAIARAILKDAPILVLDEPTSSLDAHTERQIFEALSHLMRDKTTFIISHRLSTIRRADQILALEGGHIVECGTHESLLAEGKVYAHLYKHQHLAAL